LGDEVIVTTSNNGRGKVIGILSSCYTYEHLYGSAHTKTSIEAWAAFSSLTLEELMPIPVYLVEFVEPTPNVNIEDLETMYHMHRSNMPNYKTLEDWIEANAVPRTLCSEVLLKPVL